MGVCASSQSGKTSGTKGGSATTYRTKQQSIIKVIQIDGKVQELKQPIQANHITSQNPNYFLCSSESMVVGTCIPHVSEDEELQPGQIYFLLPNSQAQKPLSLPDLCALTIKASSSLGKDALDLSSCSSRFNL